MPKYPLLGMTLTELQSVTKDLGMPAFAAKQIASWLYDKKVTSIDEMTNLSLKHRELLKGEYDLGISAPVDEMRSVDGTVKYLYQVSDNHFVEAVYIPDEDRATVCVSSQVGCKMGCRFCASTIGGWTRNLLPSEMLEQIYRIQKLSGERVSNVVVMGTGEPLDNYENLLQFIRLLTDENGLHISQRNLTVSTCGIVPKMYALAEENLQITLAISLHASNQAKRAELMPIANKYSINEVLEACRNYFEKTGRRLTFEYSLVGGKNDTKEDAEELAHLIKGLNCHVNLIPVNPIKERDYVQSDKKVIENFKNKLEKYQINVTIRREMGRDIDGACGQLRKSYIDKKEDS